MMLERFGWLVIGAGLLGVTSRVTVPPLTWIALAVLVHFTRSERPVPGLVSLWIVLFVALSVGKRGVIPANGPAYFAIIAAEAAAATLPFACDRFLAPNLGPQLSTLILPAAWVAAEFLHARLTPAASWGVLAYTQYGCLPLMQLVSIAGIWGVSFVIAWFASTFELAWGGRFDWNLAGGPALVYALIVGAIVVGGSLRVALSPTAGPGIRTATLTRPRDLFAPGEITRITEGRVSPADRDGVVTRLLRLHDAFLDGSRREARAGARLVVWPEGNLLVFGNDEAAFLDRARRLAAEEHIYLAMGMGTIHLGDALPFENKVVLVDPNGRTLFDCRKSHPVPGWEASIMKHGDGRLPMAVTSDGRMAATICFDADFPEFVRQASRNRADLLIVPSNDWKEIKDLHFQMTAFRAIENGLPLIRATASGLSAVFDPQGRVLGLSDDAAGDSTMTARVPVGRVETVYARTGDLFAWACIAGLVLAIGLVSARRAGGDLTISVSRAHRETTAGAARSAAGT